MAVKKSLITSGNIWVLELDTDPRTGIGFQAPLGSTASVNEGGVGKEYVKTGPNATDWEQEAEESDILSLQNQINQKANLAGGNAFTGDQTVNGNFLLGIGSQGADALFEMISTNKGLMIPKMTRAQKEAIASPRSGLMVFDTTLNAFSWYDGSTWLFELNLVLKNNQASTSNVYANVTELVTPTLPTGRYGFMFNGTCQSTVLTTGVGIRLNSPATVGAMVANWRMSQAGNGTDKNFEYSQLANTTDVKSASVLTANADFPVGGLGVFSLSTEGVVAIQIASEINGSGVSMRINSNLKLWKVSA